MAEVWGKLPEKERAKAMLELTRDMPPRYREVIEKYFKKLSESPEGGSK
jgi:acyl-CoA hydrolase